MAALLALQAQARQRPALTVERQRDVACDEDFGMPRRLQRRQDLQPRRLATVGRDL